MVQPPALGGSPEVAFLDGIVRRSLAKRPEERFPSARAMRNILVDHARRRGAKKRGPDAGASLLLPGCSHGRCTRKRVWKMSGRSP